MARGVDLPNVVAVVNYDAPTRCKTYVHRVGRTARAGRKGSSYTLLKKGQEVSFRRMRSMIGSSGSSSGGGGGSSSSNSSSRGVKKVEAGEWSSFVPAYKWALGKLKVVLEEEKSGRRKPHEPLELSN